MLKRYPTSAILLIQYVPLVILPAIFNRTVGPAMFSVVALGLLTSFAVEALLSPLGVRRDTTFPYSMRAVTVITYTGLAATFLSAFAGSRGYHDPSRGTRRRLASGVADDTVRTLGADRCHLRPNGTRQRRGEPRRSRPPLHH